MLHIIHDEEGEIFLIDLPDDKDINELYKEFGQLLSKGLITFSDYLTKIDYDTREYFIVATFVRWLEKHHFGNIPNYNYTLIKMIEC